MATTPYVSRSGRVVKKPEYYVPQEKPEDDFGDDEYDDDSGSETDPDEEDEEESEDDEDADENGNLKGFIVESESDSDCD